MEYSNDLLRCLEFLRTEKKDDYLRIVNFTLSLLKREEDPSHFLSITLERLEIESQALKIPQVVSVVQDLKQVLTKQIATLEKGECGVVGVRLNIQTILEYLSDVIGRKIGHRGSIGRIQHFLRDRRHGVPFLVVSNFQAALDLFREVGSEPYSIETTDRLLISLQMLIRTLRDYLSPKESGDYLPLDGK